MAGMATLTVWRFDSPYGARNALDLVERLRKEALLQLDDAAIVTWPDDRKKPKTEQLRSMAGMGALTGSFWARLPRSRRTPSIVSASCIAHASRSSSIRSPGPAG
jgi:uncharacterized membrane protein